VETFIPQIPLADFFDLILDWLTDALAGVTRAIATVVRTAMSDTVDFLTWLPPWVVILVVIAAAWWVAGKKVGIGAGIGLLLVWNIGLWEPTMSTVVLVLLSTLVAVAIGIPIGLLGGLYNRFYTVIKPILDFMQTMPAFVYLIPAIPFFGLGTVAAMFSTVIFSIPPVIRLTALGIRQIDRELIEASDAFGSTTMQKLTKVQIPVATPTIMAGVNQTIMLALSMVVIAAMIGAGGLGGEVLRAIQRLQAGMGFAAGIAVVILAIIIDRVTQALGTKSKAAE